MIYIKPSIAFYWFKVFIEEEKAGRENCVNIYFYKDNEPDAFFGIDLCTADYMEKYADEKYLCDSQIEELHKYCEKLNSGALNYFVAGLEYRDQYADMSDLNSSEQTVSMMESEESSPKFATVFVKEMNLYNPKELLRCIKFLCKELFCYDGEVGFTKQFTREYVEKEYKYAVENGYSKNAVSLDYLIYSIETE